MTQEHPITPPPELFAEWLAEAKRLHPNESLGFISGQIAQLAYRAGADMELEACCDWIVNRGEPFDELDLHNARRPKPPSLKEQAQRILVENGTTLDGRMELDPDDIAIIRRALEQLDD